MDNIFSFAPKELTNSAMWAWIISALKLGDHSSPRYSIAKNIFAKFDISVPRPEDVVELHTERSFRQINRGEVVIPSVKDRVDIFMRIGGSFPATIFVENKVVERDVDDLYRQIRRYDEQFKLIKSRLPSYVGAVYPAYFGYEDWVADQLLIHAHQLDQDFADRLKVLSVTGMINAFEESDFDREPVLAQFYSWLTVKKKFVNIRRQVRMKVRPSIGDVVDAGSEVGFGNLLEQFMVGFENCRVLKARISEVRIDIRNINFFQGSSTPLTVRWFYNSGPNGLYIGLHRNVERLTGVDLFQSLPRDFGYERDGEWIFGYLRTAEHVEQFWGPWT